MWGRSGRITCTLSLTAQSQETQTQSPTPIWANLTDDSTSTGANSYLSTNRTILEPAKLDMGMWAIGCMQYYSRVGEEEYNNRYDSRACCCRSNGRSPYLVSVDRELSMNCTDNDMIVLRYCTFRCRECTSPLSLRSRTFTLNDGKWQARHTNSLHRPDI